MKNLTTIGIDLAKNYIQIHGANEQGKPVFKKRVARDKFLETMANLPRCLVGMEACGGSNYWAKELLQLGHDSKLMSPKKVKKYTDHNKNDARDAQACSEAVGRGNMQFVPIKTEEQMNMQSLHRIRSFYVKQCTALMNMIRGLLLEYGIAIAQGKAALMKKLKILEEEFLQDEMKKEFSRLKEDLVFLNEKINYYTDQVKKVAKTNKICKQIQTIEGIGPITSTALVAKIGNGSGFKKGRELSAYLGLVPKQASSGDKQVLLGITKHGDRYVRQLLVHGGRSVINSVMRKNKSTNTFIKNDKHSQWIRKLTERVGMNKATVAIANKNARLVIGLLKNQNDFDAELAH